VVLLAVLGSFVLAACSSGPDVKFAAISGPMPRLAGPTVADGPLDPSLYTGKVVLINFWASWCGPCRREQPGLQRLWRKLAPRGEVQFIGVDHRDDRLAAQRWGERYGVTYPSVSDPDGVLGGRFDVPFLPATILVDRRGLLRYRLIGAQDPNFVEGLLEAVALLGRDS
jgi:thiol-disulfide isomerase/thioredoxin